MLSDIFLWLAPREQSIDFFLIFSCMLYRKRLEENSNEFQSYESIILPSPGLPDTDFLRGQKLILFTVLHPSPIQFFQTGHDIYSKLVNTRSQ